MNATECCIVHTLAVVLNVVNTLETCEMFMHLLKMQVFMKLASAYIHVDIFVCTLKNAYMNIARLFEGTFLNVGQCKVVYTLTFQL
jgi:hypothetical protein